MSGRLTTSCKELIQFSNERLDTEQALAMIYALRRTNPRSIRTSYDYRQATDGATIAITRLLFPNDRLGDKIAKNVPTKPLQKFTAQLHDDSVILSVGSKMPLLPPIDRVLVPHNWAAEYFDLNIFTGGDPNGSFKTIQKLTGVMLDCLYGGRR